METALLQGLLVIFALSIGVVLLFHRLRVPGIIGFLLTGVLVGPHGLGLITTSKDIEFLAELGVVLLMFTIGLEFSLKDLARLKKPLFIGGFVQVALTTALTSFVASHFGLTLPQSIIVGLIVALSSTAIIMKLLQERAEVDSPHGQIVLAICIFQDIVAVLAMLFLPTLAGTQSTGFGPLIALGKGVLIIVVVIAAALWVVPRLLHEVVRTRNRETFLLAIMVICFAVAWITSNVGLSLALGAFLAGLVLSESEYSHQALANVLPFRDMFMSLFFVSIGMLLDISLFREHFVFFIGAALGITLLKFIAAGASAVLLGMPSRTAALVGVALAPMSEFGFILGAAALQIGLLGDVQHAQLLVVSVITMAIAPLLFALSPRIAATVTLLPIPEGTNGVRMQATKRMTNHVVIVGLGPNGMAAVDAAKACGIPCLVIDMNPERVRAHKRKSHHVVFGDASSPGVLEAAGIKEARMLVVAIADAMATRMVVSTAKAVNPTLPIIARAQYASEYDVLKAAGATTVVTAESETSVALAREVRAHRKR